MSAEKLTGRRARLERTTSQSSVFVELDLDGTGRARSAPACRSTTTCCARSRSTRYRPHRACRRRHRRRRAPHRRGRRDRDRAGPARGAWRQGRDPRFGDATVPLDEALVQAVVDVSGRPYLVHEGEPTGQEYVVIGGLIGSLTRHVLEAFALHAQIALHVRVLAGRDPHHVVEAQFKALARALRDAVELDPRGRRRHALPPRVPVSGRSARKSLFLTTARATCAPRSGPSRRAGAEWHSLLARPRDIRRRRTSRPRESARYAASHAGAYNDVGRIRWVVVAGFAGGDRCLASALDTRYFLKKALNRGARPRAGNWPGTVEVPKARRSVPHIGWNASTHPGSVSSSRASRTNTSTLCTPTPVRNGTRRGPA